MKTELSCLLTDIYYKSVCVFVYVCERMSHANHPKRQCEQMLIEFRDCGLN